MFLAEPFIAQGKNYPSFSESVTALKSAFSGLEELVYCQLASQSFLKELYDGIEYTWDENSQGIRGELNEVAIKLAADIAADREAGLAETAEFARTLKGLGMMTMMDLVPFEQSLAVADEGTIAILDTVWANTTSTENNDYLRGSDGDDIICGRSGDDVLNGRQGSDTLYGGAGNDTFVFNRGDGRDRIVLDDNVGMDTLAFGAGITPDDLQLVKSGSSLLIRIGNGDDQVEVLNWFSPASADYRLDRINFIDGTSMSFFELLAAKPVYGIGTANGDQLQGYEGADILTGYAGDDNLYGNDGADVLEGGSGDDYLFGGNGNDMLSGGPGSDTLYGGAGNDTFVFNRGDGRDRIMLDDNVGIDTLAFGEGIAPGDLRLWQSGYNLTIMVGTSGDQIQLPSWFNYASSPSRLDRLRFADGTTMSFDELMEICPLNATNPVSNLNLVGSGGSDILTGGTGDDTLNGMDGSDNLGGGQGSDTLYGGAGDDLLIGGTGVDTLWGGAGNDTFVFNVGDGRDTIQLDDSAGIDTLAFGPGIALADLRMVKNGYDLEITVGDNGDVIEVPNWFSSTYAAYRLDRLTFADGTNMNFSDLLATERVHEIGAAGNDCLTGYEGADLLSGSDGDDSLNGLDGSDVLEGGPGNDTLYGGAGADLLTGGPERTHYGEEPETTPSCSTWVTAGTRSSWTTTPVSTPWLSVRG